MAIRNVISTLNNDGTEVMGPAVLMYHHPGNDIQTGSLLTVESNHFCVLKSRGGFLQRPVAMAVRGAVRLCS